MLNIFKNSIEIEIAELSKQILNDIVRNDKLYLKVDSCGINNGMKIIMEYLNYNELGLAYEHLEYVISECEIELTTDQFEKMHLIAYKLGRK